MKKSEDDSVKAPIVDGEETEYFWLTNIEFDGKNLQRLIGNDLEIVSNVNADCGGVRNA